MHRGPGEGGMDRWAGAEPRQGEFSCLGGHRVTRRDFSRLDERFFSN
jgi:hypothetical protein